MIEEVVLNYVKLVNVVGLDGVVCLFFESCMLIEKLGILFLKVILGIRFKGVF